MSNWMEIYDDTFWLTLSGILVGVCGLSLRMCYKSKCRIIDCFGLHIVRDIDNEAVIDELAIENHTDDEKESV
jgi:hypothetical protein